MRAKNYTNADLLRSAEEHQNIPLLDKGQYQLYKLLLGADDTTSSGELLSGADDSDRTDDELVLNSEDADCR